MPGVRPGERPEDAVGEEATVRDQHLDVRVGVEKLARRLHEPYGSRGDPGHALVEDAAVEVAVDRRLDTATQVAVGGEKALLVATHEVLEVVGEVTLREVSQEGGLEIQP